MRGDSLALQGDSVGALRTYEEGLAIFCQVPGAAGPEDWDYRREVAVLLNRIGGIHEIAGHKAEAMQSYREALEISRQLADERPLESKRYCDLAACHVRIGDMLAAEDDQARVPLDHAGIVHGLTSAAVR